MGRIQEGGARERYPADVNDRHLLDHKDRTHLSRAVDQSKTSDRGP
jgi:hypothetical protein